LNEYVGIVLLDVVYLLVGAALVVGLGFARALRSFLPYTGLALVVGWALVGSAEALLLTAGLSGSGAEAIAAAAVLTVAALALTRVVRPRAVRFVPTPRGALTWLAAGGLAVTLLELAALLRRALYDQPLAWDAWSFWLPKAESIVYFHGIDTSPGGFTSFTNSDYPPFAPAVESLTYRFAGRVDNGILPLQHWVICAAFVGALAVLLARRVPAWVLWPSLALLLLMPSFNHLLGSSLGDEPLSMAVALGAVTAALWLLEADDRLAVLCSAFLVAATLLKNEGLLYALLIALLLAATARGRRIVVPVALAAVSVAAIVPWKIWLRANDIPRNPAYDPHDLLRYHYLAERISRLGVAIREMPPYFFSWGAWLLALPLALVLAAVVVRRRPALAAFVLGAVAVPFAWYLVEYWITTFPIHWNIRTSADRTSASLAVLCAAVTPLLAAEALRSDRASGA